MKVGRLLDRAKLPAIKQAVHNAESDYVYQKRGYHPSLDNRVFGTAGARDATYWAMPVDHFVTYVDELGLGTGQSLGILGTGFGLDAFYAATRFMRVTGYEIDPDIYNAAEAIRSSFDVRNITFRNQDFLDADLSSFKAVSFFIPFCQDFYHLMGAALLKLPAQTWIISYRCNDERLFPADHFTSRGRYSVEPFYAFQRVGE